MSALKSKEERTMLNMFSGINLLHICNQAVWEEESLWPGNEFVQVHVAHYFLMIRYLVIALVCQTRGGKYSHIHDLSGNFDLYSRERL